MKLFTAALFLNLSLLTIHCLGAEDLDPGLQRQMNLLEAKASSTSPTTSDKLKPSTLFASSDSVATVASPSATVLTGTPNTLTAGGAASADSNVAADAVSASVSGAAKLPEAEIPVLTKFNKKVENDSVGAPTRLLATFGIVIGILGGAIFFLRRYSSGRQASVKHTQIKVVAQHHLGPKKSVAIIRVAGESILIGVTDQSISMIKQLHILDEDMPEEEVTEDFRQRLERSQQTAPRAALAPRTQAAAPAAAPAQAKTPMKRAANEPKAVRPPINARQVYESKKEEELNENDEFMMRGIRDIVSDGLRNRKTLV